MAEIGFDLQELQGQERGCLVLWGTLGHGDTGRPATLIGDRRSVQVSGDFGLNGSVAIRGSNDGKNFHVLHDLSGNELILTSPQIAAVAEATAWISPAVRGGEATAIDVTLLVKA